MQNNAVSFASNAVGFGGRRQPLDGGTHGRRELTVQRVGQRGEASLGPSRTEQHATDGGAPNGDGERGHIAEVGEIGERAQAAVGVVWIRRDLRQRGTKRSGGQQQSIVLSK